MYLLLRSRLGLVLTAVRDDEVAARSSGARVGLARMLVFVVAGAGCGAAGALLADSQLIVQPSAVFSVQFTAEMAFAVIIGGLGTIEGPILGTIVYIILQQTLQSYNAWYLIILGLVAMVIAIFARRGLWGLSTITCTSGCSRLATGYGRRTATAVAGQGVWAGAESARAVEAGIAEPVRMGDELRDLMIFT